MQRRLSTPNRNADAVSATLPAPLLRERAKAKLTNGTWKDALDFAVSVSNSISHSKKSPQIQHQFLLQNPESQIDTLLALVCVRRAEDIGATSDYYLCCFAD